MIFLIVVLASQITAQEVSSLKGLCARAGAKVSEAVLQKAIEKNMLPDDCLGPILIEKIKSKLFPLVIAQPQIELQGHTAPIQSVAMTPDGTRGICAISNEIAVFDLVNKTYITSLVDHTDTVKSVAITPNGKKVLSGSKDKTLKLWDLEDLNSVTVADVGSFDIGINSVAIDSRGQKGFFGLEDGTVGLCDLITSDTLRQVGHSDAVNAVAMTPNSALGLSGSNDATIKLWNLVSGKKIGTLDNNEPVLSVAVTADGGLGMAGSEDQTITVWDLINRKKLATLAGHTSMVLSIAITPKGHFLLSGSTDQTLKLWDLRSLLIEQLPFELLIHVYLALYRDQQQEDMVYELISEQLPEFVETENQEAEDVKQVKFKDKILKLI